MLFSEFTNIDFFRNGLRPSKPPRMTVVKEVELYDRTVIFHVSNVLRRKTIRFKLSLSAWNVSLETWQNLRILLSIETGFVKQMNLCLDHISFLMDRRFILMTSLLNPRSLYSLPLNRLNLYDNHMVFVLIPSDALMMSIVPALVIGLNHNDLLIFHQMPGGKCHPPCDGVLLVSIAPKGKASDGMRDLLTTQHQMILLLRPVSINLLSPPSIFNI